ncbi:MAG: 23S rRNA (adenine(2503)-C(2))-methyltransferase RlmN, partial [Candidatus Latescibacterota bacterium]
MVGDKKELKGLFPSELGVFLKEMGLAEYRTRQVVDWLYNKGVTKFEDMTNLSKDMRQKLDDHFTI